MTELGRKICIVKVGSAVVTTPDGDLDLKFLWSICRQLVALRADGWLPVLVSSGAKVAGRGILKRRLGEAAPIFKDERRALASIGQAQLITTYAQYLEQLAATLAPAQVLMTRQSLADRTRHIVLRETLLDLLSKGILPIINNNDVTYSPKADFVDNDQLATYLAAMLGAEIVVFVSDAGGVYDKNPKIHSDAKIIPSLSADLNWPSIEVDDTGASFGGMTNKLNSLKALAALGVSARIASKNERDVALRSVLRPKSKFGTQLHGLRRGSPHFISSPLKRWLAAGAIPTGMIVVSNPGADAIVDRASGKTVSLLAVGVLDVHGTFSEGDIVMLFDASYKPIALGRVRISSAELKHHSPETSSRIVVHADYMISASQLSFLDITTRELVRNILADTKTAGYVLETGRGNPINDEGTYIRVVLGHTEDKGLTDEVAIIGDGTSASGVVEILGTEAREAWLRAKAIHGKYGLSRDDWLLLRFAP